MAGESGGTPGTVAALHVYPVKSCAGVSLASSVLLETGLEFDRTWMVVDAAGNFLTQRELPRMVLVQPQLRAFEMVLRAPGMLALHIALSQAEAPAQVQLWGEELAATDMGPVAAQWFSDFLGVPARLVRFDPAGQRASSQQWTDGVVALNQFNDGFPVLVISNASLAHFNARLAAKGIAAVGMERFRPNIVLAALPGATPLAPHAEDWLDLLHIKTDEGAALLRMVKPCPRCPIPNVDPATGMCGTEVGDLLQSYRQNSRLNGAVSFGMNAIGLGGVGQRLRVGQLVDASLRFD